MRSRIRWRIDLLPENADAITPSWLSDALAPRYPGVRVASVEVVDRHAETNAHARLRVTYEVAAGAPSGMFCKLLPADPGMRPIIAGTGMGEREARFYSSLAPAVTMRVPAVHVAGWDADGSFVLLLEDLVGSGCTFSDGTQSVSPDQAAVALSRLAGLHRQFADRRPPWMGPPFVDTAFSTAFFVEGLTNHRDRLTDAYAGVGSFYVEHAGWLHDRWGDGPTTVIHGDPHIGNVFFDGEVVGFLDWGIISWFSPMRDVSYFIAMALSIEDRRAFEADLLKHYLADNPLLDFDAAWAAHRLQSAYTAVACCPMLNFPTDLPEANETFRMAFLARASAAVEDLETLAYLEKLV